MKGGKERESKKGKREAKRCPVNEAITAFIKLNLDLIVFVLV